MNCNLLKVSGCLVCGLIGSLYATGDYQVPEVGILHVTDTGTFLDQDNRVVNLSGVTIVKGPLAQLKANDLVNPNKSYKRKDEVEKLSPIKNLMFNTVQWLMQQTITGKDWTDVDKDGIAIVKQANPAFNGRTLLNGIFRTNSLLWTKIFGSEDKHPANSDAYVKAEDVETQDPDDPAGGFITSTKYVLYSDNFNNRRVTVENAVSVQCVAVNGSTDYVAIINDICEMIDAIETGTDRVAGVCGIAVAKGKEAEANASLCKLIADSAKNLVNRETALISSRPSGDLQSSYVEKMYNHYKNKLGDVAKIKGMFALWLVNNGLVSWSLYTYDFFDRQRNFQDMGVLNLKSS